MSSFPSEKYTEGAKNKNATPLNGKVQVSRHFSLTHTDIAVDITVYII